jgi:hypothetical protein
MTGTTATQAEKRTIYAASGIIACYQCGYGLAAFGVGPLQHAGLTLPAIFAGSAAVAVVLGFLSFAIAHRRPSPASLHPRPAGHVPEPVAAGRR